MLLIYFASVLICSAAVSHSEFSLVVPLSSVSAPLGSSVVLPCSLSPPLNSETFEVQWYKNKDSEETFLLRKAENVQETVSDARYKDRVSLIGELKKGNISLELRNLTTADEGEYVCFVETISWYEKASVNLVVNEFSLVVPESSVSAQLGSSVVLPCSLSRPINTKTFEVQWYKNKDSEETVLLHKAENVQEIRRDARYKDRVSLIGELEKGDISLELRNLTTADEGEYVCHAQSISWYEKASVNLVVKALGSPVVVSFADAGELTSEIRMVNVTCTSGGWSPKPTLTWRDSAGRELPNTHTHYRTDSEGLVSVSSWLLVSPSQSDWISCTVGLNHQEVRKSRIVPLRGSWKEAFVLTLVLSSIIIIIFTILLILSRKGLLPHCSSHKNAKAAVDSHESLQPETLPLNTQQEQGISPLAAAPEPTEEPTEERPAWQERYKVSLTLDPSTAHNCLKVSRDGKSVSCEKPNSKSDCKFPDVVSKEKFGSGQHYWEVMIWDKTSRAKPKSSWCVGVTQKPEAAPPASIFWRAYEAIWKSEYKNVLAALCYEEDIGLYTNTHDSCKISTECNMYTLGLHLNCESRTLSFYNADKPSHNHLYTFNTIPQGTLYALLSPGVKDDHPVRIIEIS